jgi:hypothetical protein
MTTSSTAGGQRIIDDAGNRATLHNQGTRTTQDVRDLELVDIMRLILDKLDAIHSAIQELDNT